MGWQCSIGSWYATPRRAVVASLLVVTCVAGCTTQSRPLVVAHRGASAEAPENTMAAFDLAWERGADLVEGDFHLTKDGFVVAHHDTDTKRTAGVEATVAAQTLSELRRHDVGAWKDPRWTGERIPLLDEVLRSVPGGRGILIEIKTDPSIVPALETVVRDAPLSRSQMTVISFDEEVIAAVKRRMPWMRAHWLSGFDHDERDGSWSPTVDEIIATAHRVQADGVDLKAEPEVLDETFIRDLRDAGLEVHVWTVNDADLARRMADLGVDSITTDRPGWLRDELRRAK